MRFWFEWLDRGEEGRRFGCTTDRLVDRFSGIDMVPPKQIID